MEVGCLFVQNFGKMEASPIHRRALCGMEGGMRGVEIFAAYARRVIKLLDWRIVSGEMKA